MELLQGWALEELLLAERLWRGKALPLALSCPGCVSTGDQPSCSPSPSLVLMAGLSHPMLGLA